MSETMKASGWRKEAGGLLYVLPEDELRRLESLWGEPPEVADAALCSGAKLIPERFGANGPEGIAGATRRLMSSLVSKINAGGAQSGEWREARFEGYPVGFDPVSFAREPECFFYIPEKGAALTPGVTGDPEPTHLISCQLGTPVSAEQMPEELRLDLEAFMAMLDGKLRVVSNVRPGRRLLPSGAAISAAGLKAEGGCYVAPIEGVACSPEAAKAVNAALEQMGFGEHSAPWPSLKDVATAAYRWDADRGMDKAAYWDEKGPGERFYCSTFVDGQSEARQEGLVTRHAARAIEWAERLAERDADVRLGSYNGPKLLERCWRARGELGRGALSLPPHKMSPKELELKRPESAEARLSSGFCPAFDSAWSEWERRKAQGDVEQESARGAPSNIKRRAMG